MPYALQPFESIPLDEELLELLIEQHERTRLPRLMRLWCYYRNALAEPSAAGGSSGPPAQRAGLPSRLIEGEETSGDDRLQREIVIENDIAWRINTLVDFMFPAALKIASKARDSRTREIINAILQAVIDANGGAALWQNAAMLGSIYGYVDFLVDCEPKGVLSRTYFVAESAANAASPQGALASNTSNLDELIDRISSSIVIETVEAPRAIPLLNQHDYRELDAYILHWNQQVHDVEREGMLERLKRAFRATPAHSNAWASGTKRATVTVTQILSATHCQRYEDGELVHETLNRLGRIPVVHVQNLAQPLYFEGLSDVEPLIPLQDELNTRLSDRANRVTMQSFRMWLGKGIDDFIERPIGPGQMWMTDNLEAEIEAFGGDADSPSERQHIEELREAFDRASGVTPAAAGHIKARVGNLTSENALRISLMGTIAKIKRKRITYGTGIEQLCELILHALDVYGVYRTEPRDRQVQITWADPITADESRRIQDALAKAQLGVPLEKLRAELGYAAATADS